MASVTKVLVTGGTGKTGRGVVRTLESQGVAVRTASRHPTGRNAVRFDWMDEGTYDAALDGVDGIYLVAPAGVLDPAPVMSGLIERAIARGVRRFVLLSSSAIPMDGPATGKVHRVLADCAPEWVVLQPSWFMQNFTVAHHGDSIRRERKIYSATGEAPIAFIDADDIGETAAACLCADQLPNDGVILTGPRAHTYDEVAALISEASGARVEHVRLNQEQLARRFNAVGLPNDYAELLAQLDAFLAGGSEARTTDHVAVLTGHPARSFKAFAQLNRDSWKA